MTLIERRAEWLERLDELHLLTPARIALILLAACLAAVVVRRLIGRMVGRVIGLGPLGAGERSSPRGRSVSGALRSAVLVAIWSIAVVAVLSELGVNITGVVFTATVIGGALAFGAQTLVRDLIAGVFVLSEDQYGVGDVIDVGHLAGASSPVTGVVERITLRATRLRDGDGRVWHVPNGVVARVANLSLQPVASLELHVHRATPPDTLRAVATGLAAAITEHSEAAPWCTGPAAYGGIVDLRDDRLVGRVSVPTQAGHHDDVRRVWRELLAIAFQDGRLTPPPPAGSA